MKRIVLALAWGSACLAAPAIANDGDLAAKVEALGRINSASAPTFSPDGRKVAYISNASGSPQVWVIDTRGGPSKQVTDFPDPIASVYWSPTADMLAFTVAPGGGLNTQIWVINADGTGARRLTPGGRENSRLSGWTRDGVQLMVASNKDNPAAIDAFLLDPVTGKWSKLVADRGLNQITDVRENVAVVSRLVGRGDTNAYLVDLTSGAETLLTQHEGKAETGWGELSPDGRTVYVLSDIGRDRKAFGRISIGADGRPGEIQYLSVRDDAVAENGVLSNDGRTAALVWNVGGRSQIAWLDTATGNVRPGPALPFDVAGAPVFSADRTKIMLSGSGADRTTDVYVIDVTSQSVNRLTESRHDGVDLAQLVRPELIQYSAHDGLKLSGWLYRPKGVTGPLPMVFAYHGGPEGQSRPIMIPEAQALVASGMAVFLPNVRGSSGFGKAFMAMDDGGKRIDAVRDIKSTTDALVAMGIADPSRLGILGGSYGGYMVMAGVTEYPDMFAAGVNLFGVVNFETFFKQSEPWMAAISTTEYGNPATELDMLRALSPIHKIDRVKTPLFVLHGANDTNVPVIEAEQIVAAMQARGVPVRYTLFPDEGHGWRKSANRVRSTTEIVEFMREHLLMK